jgi:hypothetical protein
MENNENIDIINLKDEIELLNITINNLTIEKEKNLNEIKKLTDDNNNLLEILKKYKNHILMLQQEKKDLEEIVIKQESKIIFYEKNENQFSEISTLNRHIQNLKKELEIKENKIIYLNNKIQLLNNKLNKDEEISIPIEKMTSQQIKHSNWYQFKVKPNQKVNLKKIQTKQNKNDISIEHLKLNDEFNYENFKISEKIQKKVNNLQNKFLKNYYDNEERKKRIISTDRNKYSIVAKEKNISDINIITNLNNSNKTLNNKSMNNLKEKNKIEIKEKSNNNINKEKKKLKIKTLNLDLEGSINPKEIIIDNNDNNFNVSEIQNNSNNPF